ncbi:MAG: nucleotidyltransferase family protein [Hyphomicrobium sp.]|nr:nucleotidyltransferase family protein [Hyphomicrobium sp.]
MAVPTLPRAVNTDEQIDSLLADVVLDRIPATSVNCSDNFFERACLHGVASLVYERVKATGEFTAPFATRFRQEAIARAMWELRHRTLLSHVMAALRDRGVLPVCFKGTALAYGLYQQPHHRSRGDTDLIVPLRALAATRSAFQSVGLHRQNSLPGDSVHAQEVWLWRGREGDVHAIDLHWRINNARALGDLFSYEELHATAHGLPLLGNLAVTDNVNSLIIAAFHRAVHQFDRHTVSTGSVHSGERLCWLYDIHLLSQTLTREDWDRAFSLARSKGVEATLVQSLRLAHARFETPLPDQLSGATVHWGLADRYLQKSPLQREFAEVFGWGIGRAARHLSDVILPPGDYMRSKYAAARCGWVPWLHVRRWAEGFLKRVAMSRAGA